MLEFSQKRKLRRALYSKPVVLVLFVLALFLSYTTYGMYRTARDASLRKETAAVKLATLEEREDFLTSEIQRLQTAEGIEQEVREKFDVAKEGEKVIVIVEEKATSTPEDTSDVGFFARIKSWFRE